MDWQPLKRAFRSRRVRIALGTIICSVAAEYGLELDPAWVQAILATGIVILGYQTGVRRGRAQAWSHPEAGD